MMNEHTVLHVSDIAAAKHFFCAYFDAKADQGFYDPKTDSHACFLTLPNGFRLELLTQPELCTLEARKHAEPPHIVIPAGSQEAVDTLTNRIGADKYIILSGPSFTAKNKYKSRILIFDGIELEITV